MAFPAAAKFDQNHAQLLIVLLANAKLFRNKLVSTTTNKERTRKAPTFHFSNHYSKEVIKTLACNIYIRFFSPILELKTTPVFLS